MSKPALLLTVMSFVGSILATPTPAAAAPASADTPARVRVVVDADALGDAEAFFEEHAHVSVSAALEQAGYALRDQIDAEVTVRVRMSFYNEEDLDYEIDVDISTGPELVRLETAACPQCVDEDLLARVDAIGSDVADGVARALARVDEHGAANGEPVEGERVAAIGGVGIAGGVIAGLGVGATIAGAVELSRGRVFDDPDRTPVERTFVDHRTPGGVLLGVGAVAVVAGAAMLITDVVMRSRKRKQQRAGVAHPILAPGIIGVGYIQRF
jgi:hypothetical protein